MTRQEMFNKMWEQSKINIRLQSVPACLYRDESGYKCMVGCCIKDSDYDEIIEGHTVDVLGTGLLPDYLVKERDFLKVVQHRHDVCKFTNEVPDVLIRVAKEYNLSIID